MITIHFYLRFHSTFGQTFFVTGNIPELGNNDLSQPLDMQYLNDEYWHASIELQEKPATPVQYHYILRNADGFENIENDTDRYFDLSKGKQKLVQLTDTWNYTGEFENAFYTQPFQQTLLAHKPVKVKAGSKNPTHIFRAKAPLLAANETLCICGSAPGLGNWETANAIIMRRDGNWYAAETDLAKTHFPAVYKYGIYNIDEEQFVRYETGENRILYGDSAAGQLHILHDGFAQLPNDTFRGAGVAIPVFSLRSKKSLGVGEFSDIKLLVDWAKHTGLKLIQLLPVNDTTATHTWTDSYPYAPISVFALHPIYINIEKLAGKKHAALIKGAMAQQEALNSLPDIDYEAVMLLKLGALTALYKTMKESWLADAAYQQWYEANQHWLVAYAAFCYYRDKNRTSDFSQWQTGGVYDEKAVAKLIAPKAKTFDAVAIHFFIQYQLHLQLKEAVDYSHQNGVVMKGDLPIGIYRNSADAWVDPSLYNMDAQAGAPPDDFAVKGQNWGFPTYNWKRMQEDGFAWWKQRFEQMSLYFDAFRIDHILGFFRIWSIPMHAVEGIMGHFVPCIPVDIQEFAERGTWFDHDRYCKPFINTNVLIELFGEHTNRVKENFLHNEGWDHYTLQPAFDTQRKVDAWFEAHPGTESWIKDRLFDLISNVILFEEAGSNGTKFHFRINMHETISFRYLDDHTRGKLKDLYVDYFFRRQDNFWRTEAMHKLPALKAATNMLICGEDLGMVPDSVPGVMRDLGLLSLEIQRMPKDPEKKFFHPADAPYLSVVTPSTHDMSTIRGWWEEDRYGGTQQFFNYELGQWGTAPYYCEPWINKAIVAQHLYSPAMWSIFQLQDLLGIDGGLRRENPNEERINVPANPKHYWRYRMHLSLEELLLADGFNNAVTELVKGSGR